MAIRLKYDPVGAPIIASFATGVGQMNERRRQEATRAMMYLDQSNLRYQMNQQNIQARKDIAAGRIGAIEDAARARELGRERDWYRESVMKTLPKMPEHFVPGSPEYKEWNELTGTMTKILSGTMVDPSRPEVQAEVDRIRRRIMEISERYPAPTPAERGRKGIAYMAPDGSLWEPGDERKPPGGMPVRVTPEGDIEEVPVSGAAAKAKEDKATEIAEAEKAWKSELKTYDDKLAATVDKYLPAGTEAPTRTQRLNAIMDAEAELRARGFVRPQKPESLMPAGIPTSPLPGLGGPTYTPRIEGPPPTEAAGTSTGAFMPPTAARPTGEAGMFGMAERKTGLPTSVAESGEMYAANRGAQALKQFQTTPPRTPEEAIEGLYTIFSGVPQHARDVSWAREFVAKMKDNEEFLLDPRMQELSNQAMEILRAASNKTTNRQAG